MARPKKASRDIKKTVSIRMTSRTREMLEDDFESIQSAIDWLSVNHKSNMENEDYRTTIKEHLAYMRGA